MSRHPNVILLSADALRADHTSLHEHKRSTTPFLASFASDSAMFQNCFSASSHTREAVPSLLTGMYPHIFAEAGYSLATDSIAERLSSAGYTTGGFHSNPYVSRAYGFDEGFDTFYDDLMLGQNKIFALAQRALDKFVFNKGEYHARAEEINERSLDWLDSLDEGPFFLWNHYMDPHGPYNPPSGFNEYTDRSLSNSEAQELYQKCIDDPDAITESEKELLVDLYDGEIQYLDTELRSFVEALKERDLLDNTLVIFTADHGDAFGEHGYYTHPRFLHDELVHVPLLFSSPDIGGEQIDQPVSTLDIVPSILEYCGQQSDMVDGTPLFQDQEITLETHPGYALSSAQGEDENESKRRFSIRFKGWGYFIERNVENGEIVDHHATRNGEDIDLTELESCPVNLQEVLQEHSAKCLPVGGTEFRDNETSEQVEERLESLGYK